MLLSLLLGLELRGLLLQCQVELLTHRQRLCALALQFGCSLLTTGALFLQCSQRHLLGDTLLLLAFVACLDVG
ncbi:hypothetical protein D3C76_1787660 [compost metagenome]